MQSQFHAEVLEAAIETLNLSALTAAVSGERPVVCYMSRRRMKNRRRYFTPTLAGKVEGALRDWAHRNEDVLELSVLEFDETVPFTQQIEGSRRCSILFGPHGAGLGHQIWRTPGLHVIEFGTEPTKCLTYFGAMAAWYGHTYKCFNELPRNNVKVSGKPPVFQSLNVTLLLDVLDQFSQI